MGSRAEVFRLLEAVVAGGIWHFDTARSYGRGFSEKLLGEFFRAHGGAFAVTTKCGASYIKTNACPTFIALPLNRMIRRFRDIGNVAGGGRREGAVGGRESVVGGRPSSISDLPSAKAAQITRDVVERSVEESMRQLGRGKLDIFLLHEALPEQLAPGAWEYLEGAKRAGVIGKLGVGTNRGVLEERFREEPRVEVLQYEGSVTGKLPLIERFPGKMHIHHSQFRECAPGGHGEVLRRALERNPGGKVIFSTRSREHLRENLEGLG
jgi:aryl-alcohol dehydrogenase-like predicted oxidoreductase